jgi:hypothetical protein
MSAGGQTETDFRAAGPLLDVATTPAQLSWLEPVASNFRSPNEVAFSLAEPASVHLAVYDVQGRERLLLARGHHAAGRHVVRWDEAAGTTTDNGVYFLRLHVGAHEESQKIVIAR